MLLMFTYMHMHVTYTSEQKSHTHLIPGPCFPLRWARHSVTRPAALRTVTHTVLAVNRAIRSIMKWLKTANSAKLIARAPTGFGTVLPLLCSPTEGVGDQKSTLLPGQIHVHLSHCKSNLFWHSGLKPNGEHYSSRNSFRKISESLSANVQAYF